MAAVQKVALITAGSAGLGAQIARVFAPDYRLVINYSNNQERAERLIQELSLIPATHNSPGTPRFHAVKADIGDRPSIKRLIDETIEKMGRIDVVVSNAGWTRMTNFADINDNVVDEDWNKCFNMNVKSHLYLMHAAKEQLDATEGAFISTASIAGVKPGGSSLAYSVTKAAEIHLIKGLAVGCAPKIRVNCVSPGLLPETEWGQLFSEAKTTAARNKAHLKRLPSIEDVAQQVKTLAISKSITGQNVVVDGGATV